MLRSTANSSSPVRLACLFQQSSFKDIFFEHLSTLDRWYFFRRWFMLWTFSFSSPTEIPFNSMVKSSSLKKLCLKLLAAPPSWPGAWLGRSVRAPLNGHSCGSFLPAALLAVLWRSLRPQQPGAVDEIMLISFLGLIPQTKWVNGPRGEGWVIWVPPGADCVFFD